MNMTASEKIRIIAKRVNMSMGELAEATGVILWDGDEIQRLIENSDC